MADHAWRTMDGEPDMSVQLACRLRPFQLELGSRQPPSTADTDTADLGHPLEKGHRMAKKTTDELLAQVPLFSGLSKKDLREISGLATQLKLPQGRELTHQGGRGYEFVVVLEGTVDVLIDGKVVATCGAGDFFGEMALLEDRPRTATVVAKTDVTVDVIGRPEFLVLLDDHPEIDKQLRAAMERRLAEDEALLGGTTNEP